MLNGVLKYFDLPYQINLHSQIIIISKTIVGHFCTFSWDEKQEELTVYRSSLANITPRAVHCARKVIGARVRGALIVRTSLTRCLCPTLHMGPGAPFQLMSGLIMDLPIHHQVVSDPVWPSPDLIMNHVPSLTLDLLTSMDSLDDWGSCLPPMALSCSLVQE